MEKRKKRQAQRMRSDIPTSPGGLGPLIGGHSLPPPDTDLFSFFHFSKTSSFAFVLTLHLGNFQIDLNFFLLCCHTYSQCTERPSWGRSGKESARNVGDGGLIPGSGRSLEEGNGYPLQCSCLENPMDRGAWQATVHGVAKSQIQLRE